MRQLSISMDPPPAAIPKAVLARASARWTPTRDHAAAFEHGAACHQRGDARPATGPYGRADLLGFEWSEAWSLAVHHGHRGEDAEEFAHGQLYGRGRGRLLMAAGCYLYRDGSDAFRDGWAASGGARPEFDADELAAQAEARRRHPDDHRLRERFASGARVQRAGSTDPSHFPIPKRGAEREEAFRAGYAWQRDGGVSTVRQTNDQQENRPMPENREPVFKMADAELLEPWPGLNPRKRFDPEKMQELVDSIREQGVLEPLLVHRCEKPPHRIVAGERRWRAALEAGIRDVPVLMREFTEEEALEIALVENLQRADMTAIEEARGFQRLIEAGMKQKHLATKIGRSQPFISNRVRILRLPAEILELIEDGIVEISHARDLLLPFAEVPEAKRAELYAEAVKRICSAATQTGARPVPEHAIKHAITEPARTLSHTLDPHAWGEEAALFDPDLHKQCGCNGPAFGYRFQKETRCFDDDWWTARQAEARARIDEEQRKAREAAAKRAESAGGIPVIEADEFRKTHSWDAFETVLEGATGTPRLVDASKLPVESLVLLKPSSGGPPTLVCTDMAAYKKAAAAVDREAKRRVAARKAELTDDDRNKAAQREVEPWMLAAILTHRPYRDSIMGVARELGHEMKHGNVDEAVRGMGDEDLVTLFKVLAIRCRDGRLATYNDPVEQEVKNELRKEYGPGVQALVPAPEVDAEVRSEFEEAWKAFAAAMAAAPDVPQPEDLPLPVRVAAIRSRMRVVRILEDTTGLWLTPEQEILFEESEWADWVGPEIDNESDAACLRCECTDSAACDSGCTWLAVDRERGLGICSSCAEDAEAASAQLAEAAA